MTTRDHSAKHGHLSTATLSAYVSGTGHADNDQRVEDHVIGCSQCAARLREEAQLQLLLDDAAACMLESSTVAVVARRALEAADVANQAGTCAKVANGPSQIWVGLAVAACACLALWAQPLISGHGGVSQMISDASAVAAIARTHTHQLGNTDASALHATSGRSQGRIRTRAMASAGHWAGAMAMPADGPACELPWSFAELGRDEQSLVASALGFIEPVREGGVGGFSGYFGTGGDEDYGDAICVWPPSSG